jgi:epoxyqueuosine reductase
MLINKKQGSFFFVASLLTTAEFEPDPPHLASHCGTCTACLDACPTQAFPKPGVLDAQKCISYFTIELKQPIPKEQRSALGDWVFGCDICQDVCPWNRKAPAGREPTLVGPGSEDQILGLLELFTLSPDEFRRRFKPSAMWRTKRRGLLRNAAIVLGNQRDTRAVPTLIRALLDDEPMVRGATAWALGRFQTAEAQQALRERLSLEADPAVRREIQSALDSTPHCWRTGLSGHMGISDK